LLIILQDKTKQGHTTLHGHAYPKISQQCTHWSSTLPGADLSSLTHSAWNWCIRPTSHTLSRTLLACNLTHSLQKKCETAFSSCI